MDPAFRILVEQSIRERARVQMRRFLLSVICIIGSIAPWVILYYVLPYL